MGKRLSKEVRLQLAKARDSAILAVEVYNKPGATFRSDAYLMLMSVAWTALFHAIFFSQGRKPFYRSPKNPRHFQKRDGDYRAWELTECSNEYFGPRQCAERENLRFLVGLRNRIEHRSYPELDERVFGECQACLLNFEALLVQEFGNKFALADCPALALQFSHLRDDQQGKAISRLHRPLAKHLKAYIETYRSSLGTDILNDMRFSHQVFLVPKAANRASADTLSIEFISAALAGPELESLAALIKVRTQPVTHLGKMKAKQVCARVEPVVREVVGDHAKFVHSSHHAKAAIFYGIRPRKQIADRTHTKPEYCVWDEAHGDYVYTGEWCEFLITEMRRPGQYAKICAVVL